MEERVKGYVKSEIVIHDQNLSFLHQQFQARTLPWAGSTFESSHDMTKAQDLYAPINFRNVSSHTLQGLSIF